jgi:hypothetical protein
MTGSVSDKKFNLEKYSKEIDQIEKAPNNIAKEPHYKKIAQDLLKIEGFKSVIQGPSTSEIQGVPFDFIAKKNGVISLIELKGAETTFNYPGKVQYSRLYYLLGELKKKKITPNIFLIQINLKSSSYKLRDSEFFHGTPFKKRDKGFKPKRSILIIVGYIMAVLKCWNKLK